MTVEHDDIEQILRPIRERHAVWRREMPIADMSDRFFTGSYVSPVSDWIGDPHQSDLNEMIERPEAPPPRTVEEKLAAMKPEAFLAFPESVPVLAPGHRWSLIDHRVAGSCAGQRRFCGMRLIMRPEIAELAASIHRRFFGSDLGCQRPSLREINIYSGMLGSMGLDCDSSYRYLAEGFYPIDFTDDSLDRVCGDAPDFDDLIVHRGDIKLVRESAIIAIVAPSSD